MTAYVDYTYYTATYLGTVISSTDFPALALRATAQIDMLTYDRAAAIITADTDDATIDKIQMATCAVAEELQRQDQAGGQDNVTSERVGNYSVTFGNSSRNTLTNDQKNAASAKVYLWNTGLMYKGLNEDER